MCIDRVAALPQGKAPRIVAAATIFDAQAAQRMGSTQNVAVQNAPFVNFSLDHSVKVVFTLTSPNVLAGGIAYGKSVCRSAH
jgi:hypothetical protein